MPVMGIEGYKERVEGVFSVLGFCIVSGLLRGMSMENMEEFREFIEGELKKEEEKKSEFFEI